MSTTTNELYKIIVLGDWIINLGGYKMGVFIDDDNPFFALDPNVYNLVLIKIISKTNHDQHGWIIQGKIVTYLQEEENLHNFTA